MKIFYLLCKLTGLNSNPTFDILKNINDASNYLTHTKNRNKVDSMRPKTVQIEQNTFNLNFRRWLDRSQSLFYFVPQENITVKLARLELMEMKLGVWNWGIPECCENCEARVTSLMSWRANQSVWNWSPLTFARIMMMIYYNGVSFSLCVMKNDHFLNFVKARFGCVLFCTCICQNR